MDKIKAYIARGREIEAKATPGEWTPETGEREDPGYFHGHFGRGPMLANYWEPGPKGQYISMRQQANADAEFIAHARNHHDRMLDAMEEAVNELRRLCACREPVVDKCSECRRIDRIAVILEGKDG